MLRKILLVIVAIGFSLVLTIFSGYILYKISDRYSEMQLSLMIRYIFNPIIAMLVGVLVGLLSKNHPALISIAGLMPWVLMLHSSSTCRSLGENFTWSIPILINLAFAAGCALLVRHFRSARKVHRNAGADIGTLYP